MVRKSRSTRIVQQRKLSDKKMVYERGIYAVRRPISPESVEYFDNIITNLKPEMENESRLFDSDSLGVTVIGFNRFDNRHKRFGMATREIAEKIPSSSQQIEVNLGKIGIYGSGIKHKIGFEIISPELETEVMDFETQFNESGSNLRRDFNKPDGEMNLHLCVGLMYEDHIGHFTAPETLSRLGQIALNDVDTNTIILDKISDK